MKSCKKYLIPLMAFALCMTMAFSAPAFVAGAQDTTAVVAEPIEPSEIVTTELDVDGIVGGLVGDIDPTAGEEIMDGIYETQGFLQKIVDLIDRISAFFSDIFGGILGSLGNLGNLGGGLF